MIMNAENIVEYNCTIDLKKHDVPFKYVLSLEGCIKHAAVCRSGIADMDSNGILARWYWGTGSKYELIKSNVLAKLLKICHL